MNNLTNHPKFLQFISLLVVFLSLCLFIEPSENNIFWRLPALFKDIPFIINDSVQYLMYEWMPIEVYDPEIEDFEQKPLFRELT